MHLIKSLDRNNKTILRESTPKSKIHTGLSTNVCKMTTSANSEERADYILKAVNSHKLLVDALNHIIDMYCESESEGIIEKAMAEHAGKVLEGIGE